MVLPVGFERINEKLYEEVNIPATGRPPEDFHYEPVFINTLDEVCCFLYVLILKVVHTVWGPVTIVPVVFGMAVLSLTLKLTLILILETITVK